MVDSQYGCASFSGIENGWAEKGPQPYPHAGPRAFAHPQTSSASAAPPTIYLNDNSVGLLYDTFCPMDSAYSAETAKYFYTSPAKESAGDALRAELAGLLQTQSEVRGLGLRVQDWQVDVAATLLEGKDQLLVTATGTGKSLCFLLGLFKCLNKSLIIVSPLLSLMANQVCLPPNIDLN